MILETGLKKAAKRLKQAIEQNEKITLFGDGDPDGVMAVMILEESLELLGKSPEFVFFGNRQKYGHGLGKELVDMMEKKPPGLFVALDCGITNIKGVRALKDIGFDVIIVDHHPALKGMPVADIIVDPEAFDCEDEIQHFCAAGLSFHLARVLLEKEKTISMPQSLSILAMLATISDQVPESEGNEQIIEQGLEALVGVSRPALLFLLERGDLMPSFERQDMQRYVLPVLSSAGSAGYRNHLYNFLKEESFEKVEKTGELLLKKREIQKMLVREIVGETKRKMKIEEPLIFEGAVNWPLYLAARAAGKLSREFGKPVFLYSKEEKESQGSVRLPSELNALELMEPCAKLLINYGGHPQAAGFGLKNTNLVKFKKCLIKTLKAKSK